MSQFIMIVPVGWTELDVNAINDILGMSVDALAEYANGANFWELNPLLQENGIIPADKEIAYLQVVNEQCFVKFAE